MNSHSKSAVGRGASLLAASLAPLAAPALLLGQPLLYNGSFEANGASPGGNPLSINANGPGAPLANWQPAVRGAQGNVGRNNQSNPFWDNGAIPHGRNVAFLQRNVSITQNVRGFEEGKTYVLSFAANKRGNAADPASVQVELNGAVIFGPTEVQNVEAPGNYIAAWTSYSVDISPGAGNHEIAFVNNATEDISLLLDNVRLIEKDPPQPVVVNGSFEYPGQPEFNEAIFDWATPDAPPSGQQRGTPAGWVTIIDAASTIQRAGQATAGANPFYDNGLVPDGNQVAFIQNLGAVEQLIPGFQAGTDYLIQVRANARAGSNPPDMEISLDGTPIPALTIADLPAAEAQGSRTLEWATYSAVVNNTVDGPRVLSIASTDGDNATLNIDDVIIVPVGDQDIDGPASYEFGTAAAGVPITRTFEVGNAGASALSITGVSAGGTDASDFSVISPSSYPVSVPVGGELDVVVQFDRAAAGDSSATIDIASDDPDEGTFSVAVSASVPNTPVVFNGSFELDEMGVWPGTVVPRGWTITGGVSAVDRSYGRFYDNYFDNGINPDGDSVMRIQGANAATQTVATFNAGQDYTLSFAMNARANDLVIDPLRQARIRVSVNGVNLLEEDVDPLDALNEFNTPFQTRQLTFTSPGDGAFDLTFEQLTAEDTTLLIDDVSIAPGTTSVGGWMLYSE